MIRRIAEMTLCIDALVSLRKLFNLVSAECSDSGTHALPAAVAGKADRCAFKILKFRVSHEQIKYLRRRKVGRKQERYLGKFRRAFLKISYFLFSCTGHKLYHHAAGL